MEDRGEWIGTEATGCGGDSDAVGSVALARFEKNGGCRMSARGGIAIMSSSGCDMRVTIPMASLPSVLPASPALVDGMSPPSTVSRLLTLP